MRRVTVLLAMMTVMALAMGTGTALADQHNQRSCEAAGGTWSSERGEKGCTFVEVEEGKNTNFQCTTTEESGGQGNLKNKSTGPDTSEEESNTGSGKCPPGQYRP